MSAKSIHFICYLNVSSSPNTNNAKTRMFQVRRTFLLIVTFDLIFMGLLWIIYNQVVLIFIIFNINLIFLDT